MSFRTQGRHRVTVAGVLFAVAASLIPVAAQVTFQDVAAASGIDFRNVCGSEPGSKGWLSESMGAGAAWLDYDGDGFLDLYLVNGSTFERKGPGEPNRLFRNDGKGHFVDVTERAGVGHRGWGYGVAVGDFDSDGHPDLYIGNNGKNVLYRNKGDGTFEDVTEAAGVGNDLYSTAAAFFDLEGDGDLDLYVANYMEGDPTKVPRRGTREALMPTCNYKGIDVVCGPLRQVALQDAFYRNNGDGTFTDATRAAGVWLEQPRFALGVVTVDYDNDGDVDVYVANDSVANSLWENRGDGTFVDVGLRKLAALNTDGQPQAGMGTNTGDYNGDGWLDLVTTNFSNDVNTIYRNTAGKFFVDDSMMLGMRATFLNLSWGTGLYDLDQDGDLDLFIANGHVYPQMDDHELGSRFIDTNHLFIQQQGRFTESSASSGPGFGLRRSFRGAAFADYDEDGDVDILVTTLGDAPALLRNDTKTDGHHLQVKLVGSSSNRDGIGARVTAVAGDRRWIRERKGGGSYLSASDPRLYFGLGSVTKLDRLEIRWPSGKRDVLRDVAVDRTITVKEGD